MELFQGLVHHFDILLKLLYALSILLQNVTHFDKEVLRVADINAQKLQNHFQHSFFVFGKNVLVFRYRFCLFQNSFILVFHNKFVKHSVSIGYKKPGNGQIRLLLILYLVAFQEKLKLLNFACCL